MKRWKTKKIFFSGSSAAEGRRSSEAAVEFEAGFWGSTTPKDVNVEPEGQENEGLLDIQGVGLVEEGGKLESCAILWRVGRMRVLRCTLPGQPKNLLVGRVCLR